MPAQSRDSRIRDGYQGSQQFTLVESNQAGPSSSVRSARHNGHTKAREHDAGYRPQRQVEQYTAGGL